MAANDGSAPPNSLEAVHACLGMRAAWIEVDATALADADYLLVHDSDLESETTGSGPVAACSTERGANLYCKRDGAATTCRVPRLSEVVHVILRDAGPSRLQVDFKNVEPFPTDEPLRRLIEILGPLRDRGLVSSEADWQLRRLRGLAPWLALGLDVHFYLDWRGSSAESGPSRYPRARGAYGYWDDHPIAQQRIWPTAQYLSDRCQALVGLVPGVTTFYVNHRFLCRCLDDGFDWADQLHQAGIKLDAWTLDADNPTAVTNARRLLAAGVDLGFSPPPSIVPFTHRPARLTNRPTTISQPVDFRLMRVSITPFK